MGTETCPPLSSFCAKTFEYRSENHSILAQILPSENAKDRPGLQPSSRGNQNRIHLTGGWLRNSEQRFRLAYRENGRKEKGRHLVGVFTFLARPRVSLRTALSAFRTGQYWTLLIRLLPNCKSGRGSVWWSAAFGTQRSLVQIQSSRPRKNGGISMGYSAWATRILAIVAIWVALSFSRFAVLPLEC